MKRIGLYLLFSFLIAWLIWIGCYAIGLNSIISQILVSASMWAPAAAVWLTKKLTGNEKIITFGLTPKINGNIKWYLAAWFAPVIITLLGGALYFAIFSDNFDISLGYLRQMIEAQGVQLDGTVSIQLIALTQLLGALTYGPIINMFFAFGEEVGWRGFLFPEIASRMSSWKAYILTGLIWGIWHTPINMMGHNYGLGYPWMGIVAMCVFTISVGVFLSWLTEKSGSVWPAALAHGSINAAAGLPFIFLSTDKPYNQLLGPATSGLIACLPMLALAVFLALKKSEKRA